MDTVASGLRGHPPRSHLARVERGNPVGVRVEQLPGRLTVRKAQSPSGNRMAQEANAGSRKAAGNRGRRLVLQPVLTENWPDAGTCPSPKGR